MDRPIAAVCFFLIFTGCIPREAVREAKKQDCIRTVAGSVVEYGRPEEVVKPFDGWQMLNESDRKIIFDRSRISGCRDPKGTPLEKTYQLAIFVNGKQGYDVRVWPVGEPFRE